MTVLSGRKVGRRRVLGATPAAVTAVAAGTAPGTAAAAAKSSAPAGAAFLPQDSQLHLLRRATYGPTPASIAEMRRLGVSRWLDRQLRPATIADPVCDDLMARLPLAGVSVAEIRRRVASGQLEKFTWDALRQVGYAAVARAIWSERQLLEVMVDFWSNHLNVTCPLGDVWDSRQDYDRNVIRRFALGRFADMLKASAKHPAMLTYLDNRFSTKSSPNENYARELLELHTVGLTYSETDVKNAARLLTGLTVGSDGAYRYDSASHAVGAVSVVGFKYANNAASGGEQAAMALLDRLARSPATARRIATKLCVRFVADHPPATLVKKLADVYLRQRTAIAPVLKTLFTSPEFAAAVGAKVRTPFEDVAATVRVLGFGPERVIADSNPSGTKGLEALHWTLVTAGHAPMGWKPPNGYPDVAEAWASPSGQVIRWNAHLNITAGWWPNQLVRPKNLIVDLIGAVPATYGDLIDELSMRLLGRTMKNDHRVVIARYYGKSTSSPLSPNDQAVSWGAAHLVAMMLNTPYFALR